MQGRSGVKPEEHHVDTYLELQFTVSFLFTSYIHAFLLTKSFEQHLANIRFRQELLS